MTGFYASSVLTQLALVGVLVCIISWLLTVKPLPLSSSKMTAGNTSALSLKQYPLQTWKFEYDDDYAFAGVSTRRTPQPSVG